MKYTWSAGGSPVRTYVRRLATLVLAAGFLAACNMDEVDQSLLPPSMQTPPVDAAPPGADEPPSHTDNPGGAPSETPEGDGNADGDSPPLGDPSQADAPSQNPGGPGGDQPGGEPIDEDPHAVPDDDDFPHDDGVAPGDDGTAGDDQVPADDGSPSDDQVPADDGSPTDDENSGAGDSDDGDHDPGLDDDGLGAEDPGNGDADDPAFLSVTLSWEQPLERVDGSALTDLAGFKLRYGTSEEELDQEVVLDNAGLSRYVVENLSPGEWFFAVSAFDRQGRESALSNFVAVQVE